MALIVLILGAAGVCGFMLAGVFGIFLVILGLILCLPTLSAISYFILMLGDAY